MELRDDTIAPPCNKTCTAERLFLATKTNSIFFFKLLSTLFQMGTNVRKLKVKNDKLEIRAGLSGERDYRGRMNVS